MSNILEMDPTYHQRYILHTDGLSAEGAKADVKKCFLFFSFIFVKIFSNFSRCYIPIFNGLVVKTYSYLYQLRKMLKWTSSTPPFLQQKCCMLNDHWSVTPVLKSLCLLLRKSIAVKISPRRPHTLSRLVPLARCNLLSQV